MDTAYSFARCTSHDLTELTETAHLAAEPLLAVPTWARPLAHILRIKHQPASHTLHGSLPGKATIPRLASATPKYINSTDNITPACELTVGDDLSSDGDTTTQENNKEDNVPQLRGTLGFFSDCLRLSPHQEGNDYTDCQPGGWFANMPLGDWHWGPY